MNSLGLGHYGKGNNGQAETFYNEAKRIYEELDLTESLVYSNVIGNLALLYNILGQVERSDNLYLESLDIVEQTAGRESADYATSAMNYGSFLVEMGNMEEGIRFQEEALKVAKIVFGEENVRYADHLLNYAEALYLAVDYNGAMINDKKAADIYKKYASDGDPRYAYALGGLAPDLSGSCRFQ